MTRRTRHQRAEALFAMLRHGPDFTARDFDGPDETRPPHGIARDAYRLWARSWILNAVCELVPELRHCEVRNDPRRHHRRPDL